VNRREFAYIAAGAAVSSMLPSSLLAQQPPPERSRVSGPVSELYKRALILDCNSGPLCQGGPLPLPQTDLDIVRESGINVVKWTLGGTNADFAETVKQIACVGQLIEVHPSYFTQVRVPADFERAKREAKMGVILGSLYPDSPDSQL